MNILCFDIKRLNVPRVTNVNCHWCARQWAAMTLSKHVCHQLNGPQRETRANKKHKHIHHYYKEHIMRLYSVHMACYSDCLGKQNKDKKGK